LIFWHPSVGPGCHQGLGTETRAAAAAAISSDALVAGTSGRGCYGVNATAGVSTGSHQSVVGDLVLTYMAAHLHILAVVAVDIGSYICFDFDSGTDPVPLTPQYFHSFWPAPNASQYY